MFLLNVDTRVLEQFAEGNIPGHAILSHTWGSDEATFEDYRHGNRPETPTAAGTPPVSQQHHARHWYDRRYKKIRSTKSVRPRRAAELQRRKSPLPGAGHAKIDACCRTAKADGFQYVWIDTCCIDKQSSAELSEAINSMFAWYARASICYVYLADVQPADSLDTQQDTDTTRDIHATRPRGLSATQIAESKASRWFTRGWTLQECLAPDRLHILDSSWTLIGYSHRRSHNPDSIVLGDMSVPSLTSLLSEITGIPYNFLWDTDIHTASVAERMRWASSRQTTRTEDQAYCLLGIFDVSMSMIYGEGKHAFDRLQHEIIKRYDDQSILAFGSIADDERSFQFVDLNKLDRKDILLNDGYSPLRWQCLATTARSFHSQRTIVRRKPNHELASHYDVTHVGVSISLPMIQLPSGEWLARLDCSVVPGGAVSSLSDKYLCLVLVPSHTQPNIMFRRGDGGLTLVPLAYFMASYRSPAVRRSVYLASFVSTESYRKGPVVIPDSFVEAFCVRTTYPPIRDRRHGTQLWSTIPSGDRLQSEIYLDCADYHGTKSFALRVWMTAEGDGEGNVSPGAATVHGVPSPNASVFWRTARLYICHQRDTFTMAELMLNAPGSCASGRQTAADDDADYCDPHTEPAIKWEARPVVSGHEILLVQFGYRRWKLEVKPILQARISKAETL
ncbi:HET domain-containing protein [Microdochium nivale]|nr:HET domain-containing protein [Microdochium nivale]